MKTAVAVFLGLFPLLFLTSSANLIASEEDDADWQDKAQKTLQDAQIFFDNINTTLQRLQDQTSGVDERFEKLELNPCVRPTTPAEQLRVLEILITRGSSYKSETLEEIPRDSQAKAYIAIEIKNFLEVPLKNFRSKISGLMGRPAPKSILNYTSEVFSLSGGKYFSEGSFSYDIGPTQGSLHVYFLSTTTSRKLAIAFLDKSESINRIYRAADGTSVTAVPSAFSSTGADGITEKKGIILEIHKGDFHARATSRVITTDKHVLSIDVYFFQSKNI